MAKCWIILRPIRYIFSVILKIFWYCFRVNPSFAIDENYGDSTTLTLLTNDNLNNDIQLSKPNGPLLAFSYAGMLWAYYLGVIAFLRDHFDIFSSNICLSGISCGTSAVLVIFLDLSIEQGFDFGLEWQKLFDNRPLKFWFLSTSQILNMILNKFKKFGIDDKILTKQYKKYGVNNLHFGVTALKLPNWYKCWKYSKFHKCLNNFGSLKQMVYAGLCSMRTVPFFRTLGFYGGHYVLDGALTSNYCIPQIYRNHNLHRLNDKDKVIRISVMNHKSVPADIKPIKNFKWNEWVISGDLNDNLIRFNKGYKDAAQLLSIFSCVKKGLIWNNIFDYNMIHKNEMNVNKWNCHLEKNIEQWNEKIKMYIENQ
eukprot:411021_1